MTVKEVEYKVYGKRKFLVNDGKSEYVCYKCLFESSMTCVINAKTKEEITNTRKGLSILLNCQ